MACSEETKTRAPRREFTEEEKQARRERRRRAALKGFRIHLAVYLASVFALLVIDLTTPGGPWFQYPAVAWLVGIVAHGAAVDALDLGGAWSWLASRFNGRLHKAPKTMNAEPPKPD